MLKAARSYEEACRTFRWRIPDLYNLAFDVCDRQTMAGADGHRTALVVEGTDGSVERYTFHVLRLLSNRLANVLTAAGVGDGDPVLIGLPASVEAAIAVLAVTKMGAIAVPVPAGLGAEPVGWRLADCGAKAAVTTPDMAAAIVAAGRSIPHPPALVLAAGEAPTGSRDLWAILEQASDAFAPAVTAPDHPAFLFYPPLASARTPGVLHAHRAVPGNLPAMEFALDFFAQSGDVLWSAYDWMSLEGLLWGILPAWHHGVPVIAYPGGFDPEHALGLMARHGVRAALLPPHEMAELAAVAGNRPHHMPRALATGPLPLDEAASAAVERCFGVTANQIWGLPETGALAANNPRLLERMPGSPGRALPGMTVEAIDPQQGRVLNAGESGILAAAEGLPGGFLGYWPKGDGGRHLTNGWLSSGWPGLRDLDGYLWPSPPPPPPRGAFDLGGRRIVLAEVEAALAAHPRVSEAVILTHIPGEMRAFVAPAPGIAGDDALSADLRGWIAARRAVYEVPHRIEYVDRLPRAEDGSIDRKALARRPMRLDAPFAGDRLPSTKR